MRTVLLYGRPGCHLCDQAREELERLRESGAPFLVEEVDIECSDELLRSHLERIPVIELDGAEVSELGLDGDELLARLGTVAP